MPSYCPTCKGILRPDKGTLVCIRCTQQARARTVFSGGRRIQLAQGQQGLRAAEPALAPQAPSWKRQVAGAAPHPQLGLFPYDEIRDGQKRFARDVATAVQGGRHLVAQAPTGIGKTAASLAPAIQDALASDRTVLFLTSRQSQHRIAVETVRTIVERRGVSVPLVDLVSKRDMCLRHEAADMHAARFSEFCMRETRAKSCQYLGTPDEGTLRTVKDGVLHVSELMHVAKQAQLCPHIVAMAASPSAKVIVADYNHLFSDLRERSLERFGLDLGRITVIVDEAHNLPDRIRQEHSHRITPYLLDMVGAEAASVRLGVVERDAEALKAAITRLSAADGRTVVSEGALHEAFEQARKGLLATRRTLDDVVEDLRKMAVLLRKEADSDLHCETLADALESWGRFRDGALRYVESDAGSTSLHIHLLDPSLAARAVLQGVHSAILMSGTLRPPEMVADILGLAPERTMMRAYPSPFPQENLLVAVAHGISSRFTQRSDELWIRMAATVADVAASCTGNLAVFAPSYAVLREVRAAMPANAKENLVEEPGWGKQERDQVLDTLAATRRKGGAILWGVLGGSFAEGVDFRDNLLSAIVVVGLPLAPPDLVVDATVAYLEKRFPGRGRTYGYTVPAMNRVLQAMGRAVRSAEDKCAVVLLDERYLGPPYRGMLPEVVATQEPARVAGHFLRAHGL